MEKNQKRLKKFRKNRKQKCFYELGENILILGVKYENYWENKSLFYKNEEFFENFFYEKCQKNSEDSKNRLEKRKNFKFFEPGKYYNKTIVNKL